jgi:hypothetical protein
MCEFWLAASEMSFRKQNMMNFQIQLTKRQGISPMTRGYIEREEQRPAQRERRHVADATISRRVVERPQRLSFSKHGDLPRMARASPPTIKASKEELSIGSFSTVTPADVPINPSASERKRTS